MSTVWLTHEIRPADVSDFVSGLERHIGYKFKGNPRFLRWFLRGINVRPALVIGDLVSLTGGQVS